MFASNMNYKGEKMITQQVCHFLERNTKGKGMLIIT